MSKTAEKETKKAAKNTSENGKKVKGFTADERAAMKERAAELKAAARAEEGEATLLAKIKEMSESERTIASGIHAIVKANAPQLEPKTWYGMPAYANKDGKIVCFYQSADKFGARYGTLGFNDSANLDDGVLWPTSFAVKEINAAVEAKIAALVKKAVS
jgi:uncharacterized protein YdhG (YjbR/CyaY superfamily)